MVLILGVLASWIGSFSSYAYGELFDNTKKILDNTMINNSDKTLIYVDNEILLKINESE